MAFSFPKRNRSTRSKRSTSSSSTSLIPLILNLLYRTLQLIFAVAVIGLYAQDLRKAHLEHKYTDSKWAFATAIGTLSAATAIVYMIPMVPKRLCTPWDILLFFLWIVVFGIFGDLYIGENAEGDSGVSRMKGAVWVDLVNLLLWLGSAISGGVAWWNNRGGRSLHTGRAAV
jgi:hypothetical protein